jgi:hypothetical protein
VSSALAIAGVTAVLRDLLNDGMINHNVSGILGSTITVSAVPPDRVVPANGTESTQLNLFLHRVTPNQGWRNSALPSRDSSGRHRLTNPPLALDLHYLLSAYSADELGAEILLGYAMQLLHETPVLDRRAITVALNPSPSVGSALPPALQALASCGLAEQIEQIRVTPQILSTEEMSRIWTAVQSHYRPTTAYTASVVLIESVQPARAALPVLSRGGMDSETGRERGVVVQASLLPPFPTIESVVAANKQPVATVGEQLILTGHHLNGTSRTAAFSNARLAIEQEVEAVEGSSSTSLQVTVPSLPVGTYQVSVNVVPPNEAAPRASNQLAAVIGPEITTALPTSVTRDAAGTAIITLSCRPAVLPGQQVSLLLGTEQIAAQPFSEAATELVFVVHKATPGEHLVRLRVDGVESPLINRLATPPVFFNHRIAIQ